MSPGCISRILIGPTVFPHPITPSATLLSPAL